MSASVFATEGSPVLAPYPVQHQNQIYNAAGISVHVEGKAPVALEY
jgi:hypothetical protein